MKISAAKIPLLSKQKIAEKTLKIDRGVVNAFYKILVIGPYECIAEVP